MKRYFIETAKCDVTEGGMACGPVSGDIVVSVKFREGSKSQWIHLIEVGGIPNTYLTDKDIHDELLEDEFDDEFTEYMNEHFINEFDGIALEDDYYPTFASIAEDPDNPAAPLIRYLITLVRCEMDDVEGLIQMASGKYADELDIPVSDAEEDFLAEYEEDEDFDVELPENLDQETLYRMRLALEADVETESVFHDMDEEAFSAERAKLTAVKERCTDEADFQSWKDAYISSEFEKVKEKNFLVCTYMFAGIGQYEMIIPAEQKESFICWINGNGSAFFGGERAAEEDEIKKYIALQADADLN